MNREIKKGRPGRRQGSPRALAATLDGITRPIFSKRGFANAAVAKEWPAIVGAQLAMQSQPEKVTFPAGKRGDGTLHLRIASGSLALELQHLEPLLIERINSYFGYRAITRLTYIQGPVWKPPGQTPPPPARPLAPAEEEILSGLLTQIDDMELRAALETLGRSLTIRGKAQK
ncbi:MAG: DciA family protein [Rhodospirillales bacterium]|nr:DciA family protein [Rhodospirillales bacterium]